MLRGYGQPKMSILVELYTLIDISFFSCFFFLYAEHGFGLQLLMNDINSSLESLNSACNMQSDTDTVPLLQNGQHASNQPAASSSRSLQPQASPRQKVQRSQPVHILPIRWAQRRYCLHRYYSLSSKW